jgi:hypothetical protein
MRSPAGHLWSENMTRIDLGNYSLRIFHTLRVILQAAFRSSRLRMVYSSRPIACLQWYFVLHCRIRQHRRLHRFSDSTALLRPAGVYPGTAESLLCRGKALMTQLPMREILAARNDGGPEISTRTRMRIGSSDYLPIPSSRLLRTLA